MDIIDPKNFENIGVFKGFKSLKYKVLIKVLTVSALVTFFMTALSVYNDYTDEKQNFVSALGQIEKVVVPSITEDVWLFDLANIKNQLDLLMGMEEIVYSEVLIGNSDVITPSYSAKVSDTIKEYNYSLLKNGKALGTIKLMTTMDHIYERVQKRVFTFLGFQAIKTFLVSFLIVWIFQKYVVKYLEKIVVYLKDFQNLSENGILDVKSTNLKSVDELDILIASFNNLLAKLGKAEEKLLDDLQTQKSFSLNSAKMASVGEMAGGAAHEINNPLAIIDGQFHMLEVLYENGQLNKENFRKIANTCSNAILRISKILTSLQFLTQRQYSNKYEIISIDHLLEMVTSLYRQRLKQHQIRIKINVHEDIKVCCTPQGICRSTSKFNEQFAL